MQLPTTPSPSAIVTFLRVNNYHDYLSSDEAVRAFCTKYYPGIEPRVMESTVRTARTHRTQKTDFEKKLQNSIFSHIPGITN